MRNINVTNGKFFEEENKEGPPQKITLSGGYYKHILRKRMSDIQIHANSSPVCQKKIKYYHKSVLDHCYLFVETSSDIVFKKSQ